MPLYRLNVNGQPREATAEADTPLLYVLRNDLELNAAKFGCGLGQCGSCTVLVDGEPQRSCRMPVGAVGDKPVTTLEGLGAPTRRTSCRRPSSTNRRCSAAIASTG